MSFVYFFVTSGPNDMTMCKIGFTKAFPERRRREVQGMCPTELELFAFINGDMSLEQKLHRTFAPLRYHGEWFVLEGKLHDFLYYLVPDGPCEEPTSNSKFWNAVHDCVLAGCVPHPELDHEEYMGSADMSEWEFYRGETVQ